MSAKIRLVPLVPDMHIEHYQFLTELRNAVVQLQSSTLPPDDPSNLTASGIALGNVVQFTRSKNAQRYTIYISNSPTRSATDHQGSIAVDVGDSNTFTDMVGAANFTRYYWVRAWNGQQGGRMVGPIKCTSLAANTSVAPPKQVPAGPAVIDQQTGGVVVGRSILIPGGGGRGV